MATCYSGLGHAYMVVIAFYESEMLGKYKLANRTYTVRVFVESYRIRRTVYVNIVYCTVHKNTDII